MNRLQGRNSASGRPFRLLGVGSPLLDILIGVDDAFLEGIDGGKGGMIMVDAATQNALLDQLTGAPRLVPGGSTGNTVFGLARLGMPVAMLGKLGEDEHGRFYRERLQELGGDCSAFRTTDSLPTGCCLSLITPDAERTMRTSLAAATALSIEEAEAVIYANYDFVYIEGYMLFSPVFPSVLRLAKAAGCRIGMDLASFEVTAHFRDSLPMILEEYIDVVTANEDEADALLPGLPCEEQLDTLAGWCEIAAIKLGRAGSMVQSGNETVKVPALIVDEPVDTTAAGDLWLAGFLYGLYQGKSLAEAAFYGSLLGAEVVKVVGSEIPEERWRYIRTKMGE